jgi:hypothetical protein
MDDGRSMIELLADASKLAIHDAAANLTAQLSEWDELRERVRKAEQSAHQSGNGPTARGDFLPPGSTLPKVRGFLASLTALEVCLFIGR